MAQYDLIATATERSSHANLRPVNVAGVLRAAQARLAAESRIDVTIEVDESVHVAADENTLMSAVCALLREAAELAPAKRLFLSGRACEAGVMVQVEPDGEATALMRAAASVSTAARQRLAAVKASIEAMCGEAHWSTGTERSGAFALLFRWSPATSPVLHRNLPSIDAI